MKDIFEKLRSGEDVDMTQPEYQEAIKEMQRSTHLCARINGLTQFRDGTSNWTNELFTDPMGEGSHITPNTVVAGNPAKVIRTL